MWHVREWVVATLLFVATAVPAAGEPAEWDATAWLDAAEAAVERLAGGGEGGGEADGWVMLDLRGKLLAELAAAGERERAAAQLGPLREAVAAVADEEYGEHAPEVLPAALAALGRHDEADEALRALPEPGHRGSAAALLLDRHLDADDHDRARELLPEAVRLARLHQDEARQEAAADPEVLVGIGYWPTLMDAARELDDLERARAVADMEIAEPLERAIVLAKLARHEAEAEAYEPAHAHLRRALETAAAEMERLHAVEQAPSRELMRKQEAAEQEPDPERRAELEEAAEREYQRAEDEDEGLLMGDLEGAVVAIAVADVLLQGRGHSLPQDDPAVRRFQFAYGPWQTDATNPVANAASARAAGLPPQMPEHAKDVTWESALAPLLAADEESRAYLGYQLHPALADAAAAGLLQHVPAARVAEALAAFPDEPRAMANLGIATGLRLHDRRE